MPSKRAVLEALARDDLLQLVDACELQVADRRKKDGLVDALVASKKAHLDELLASLSRDSLKALCRALGLSDAGKEKAVIIERILGGSRQEPMAALKPATATKAAAPPEPARSRPPEDARPQAPATRATGPKATTAGPATESLDRILALQFLVAWAGEGRSDPRRLGWWDTDLVDEAGGGDLLARLAPRTHRWASLELVREAARRADQAARRQHGDPDRLRTLYFLGFELDERLHDRVVELKRQGKPPETVLPLPFKLGAEFDRDRVVELLSKAGKVAFDKVPPVGRQLKGAAPVAPEAMIEALASALVPLADDYPLPFFKVGP